jgi:hypothetical protein
MGLTQYIYLLLSPETKAKLQAEMAAAAKAGGDAMGRSMADATRQMEQQQQTTWQKMKGFVGGFAQGAKDEFAKQTAASAAAAKQTESHGGIMSRAWHHVKDEIISLGATIGAVFAVHRIYEFLKESVEGAEQAARAWRGLGQAVDNTGGSWARQGPVITATLQKLGDKYLFDPDDLAKSMSKVTIAVGDSSKALQVMDVAAALSRRSGLGLSESADLLTRALVTGQARGLAPWVGSLKGSTDILGDVKSRLGDVMSTLTPMERSSLAVSVAWQEFKDRLGDALVSMIETSDLLPVLADGIKVMLDWVIKNREGIGEWASFIIRAIKVGLIPAWGALVAAFDLVKAGWYGLEAVFYAGAAIWDTLKLGVLDLVATIDKAMIALDTALEKGLRFIGQGELADSLHKSVVEMTVDFNHLKEEAAKAATSQVENNRKATEAGQNMAKAMNAANTSLRDGFMKAGDAVHDWATDVQTDSEGASDSVGEAATAVIGHTERMTAAQIKAAQAAAAAFKKAQEDLTSSYWQMVNGTDAMTKQILAQATAYAKQATADASKANSDFLKQFTRTAEDETAAQANANLQRLQGELATQQKILQSATATADEKRAAFQKSADLEQQIDAERLASAQATNKDYMQSREYAEQESRNAMNETAGVAEDANGRMGAAAGEAAMTTREKWRAALDAIAGAAAGIGGIFGGVMKGVASLASQGSSAIGNIGKAIDGLKGPMGGFTGFLSKLPGMLGAIGSAVGLITTVGGIVAHMFKGSKDPGRFNSDEEAYKTGMGGDAQARADASEYFKERAFVALGGGGQWATSIAQRDASEKWISTLRARVIRDHDPGALAELRAVFSRLATAGFVEYKAWADAERRAIPQGIPGFQYGGVMQQTGLAALHQGELVLPAYLTRQLAALAGGGRSGAGGQSWDNRQLVVNQVFNGIADADIPARAVQAIQQAIGQGYQRQAALQGHTRLPT